MSDIVAGFTVVTPEVNTAARLTYRVGHATLPGMEAVASGRNASLGRVFVVDDDEPMRRTLSRALQRAEFGPVTFDSPAKLLAALANDPDVDLVISDVRMPEMNGLDLLSAVKDSWPHIPVMFLTGQADVSTAVEAMRRGGYDFLTKPFDPTETLLPAVRRAVSHRRLASQNQLLQRQLDTRTRHPHIVGESRLIREVFSLISSVAPTDSTVLVTGESGTGKELVARSIHDQSRRSNGPFVDVNCGALSETVLESELFGHTKGAFTGAISARRGVFEEASGGTLFLDEVGELSAATQVKLLRVLQEGVIRPVGADQSHEVDVRVVAATNRDLATEVEEGRFRQDLFYRLDVLTIHVPPLRQRKEDIPILVHHFLRKHAERLNAPVTSVASETLERLVAHRWPGNVRELENAVERALVLAKSDCFSVDLLPEPWRKSPLVREPGADPRLLMTLADAKGAFEREYLERLLDRAEGKLGDAARLAGVDPSNLRRLLKRHDMTAR